MKIDFTLIAGILTAILLWIYVLEAIVLMDSLIYLYFK